MTQQRIFARGGRHSRALANYRVNPTAGGGLAADWSPRSPTAGYAERYAHKGNLLTKAYNVVIL